MVEAHDLDGNRELDLLAVGDFGLRLALFDGYDVVPEADYLLVDLLPEQPTTFECFDMGNDDDLDIAVAVGTRLFVLETRRNPDVNAKVRLVFEPPGFELAALPAAPAEILASDYDHDGDLDLLVCGSFGLRVLRCDGANTKSEQEIDTPFLGGFTDATTETGLAATGNYTWILSEDYDSDQDVDYLLGGPGDVVLASNLRAGRFEDVAARDFGAPVKLPRRAVVADFDGDARPDVFEPGEPSRLWMRTREQRYAAQPCTLAIPATGDPLVDVDLDLDGALDVVWRGENDLAGTAISIATPQQKQGRIAGTPGNGPIVVCDRDRDLKFDILRAASNGIELWRCTSPVGNGCLQQWFGLKDNKQGVGAIVEIRAGELYRRIYWRGDPVLIGIADKSLFDVVRITWPNGVLQSKPDWECGKMLDFKAAEQPSGLIGSCPFLYTWNGTTNTFVSDVLGITPLGLPMAPGELVPPDHDEYVLVRGDQLVPKDGLLELQFTEELREVTYLDRMRIDAVDHPIGTEIHPNELFCFPPFPEPHIHTVRDPLSPSRATGSDGKDWTAALAQVDGEHAIPFEPLQGQFQGLATPHWLELEFDRARVASAKKLRLVFTGWFFWTDASVNMASARTPQVRFVPPILQVPQGSEWVDAGPPIGFPAGKTKSMVIDVSTILSREDPRLRIFSTLRLYWDSVRLAVDDDDAEIVVQSVEPASAKLWRRGFSAPAECSDQLPERFVWSMLAAQPRWDQHPGMYTRYGECVPLLTAVDDCFVVLGAGDALSVRFDAKTLAEPAPGFVRDWLVYLDGWAKDRDPNTVDALEVEPLPFHGMSGYPYRSDEHFPDDELHRKWRSEWQTRPAYQWIEPLAPRRIAEDAANARPTDAAAGR
jgi:hypothetical protein